MSDTEQLTLFAEEAPASPSRSREDARAFQANLASCSSLLDVWQSFARVGFSGKTSPEFLTLETMHSPNFSGKFKKSGISVSHGEFLMLNSSEWPNDAAVCSLSDTLEGGGRAAAVLFEPESLSGNTLTSREKRAALAGDAARSARAGGFTSGMGAKAGGVGFEVEQSPTLVTGSVPAISIQGDGSTSTNSHGGGYSEEVAYTINTIDKHSVAYRPRSEGL